MSIFRRDSNPPAPYDNVPATPSPVKPSPSKQPRPPGRGSTYIAPGSRVEGEVSGNSELVVDGNLDGEIALHNKVIVGADGVVRGQINAVAIEVAGKVIGNIRGTERVEVLASGTLEGDVVSPRIIISEGAFFKGKVEMTDPKAAQKVSPKIQTPSASPPAAQSAARPPARPTGESKSPDQGRPSGADRGRGRGPRPGGSGG